ncbi:mycofactocin precursor MftA [Streptomyces sp. SKN60]|nr:mycofactocin precursor MftA [Streptomyces sp. SKN60]MCX2184582.1 mycofactocin precursor MftA [Streptomyces sp. SKN60]
MNEHTETATTALRQGAVTPAEDALYEEDLLVEEVSIDGMCGVY